MSNKKYIISPTAEYLLRELVFASTMIILAGIVYLIFSSLNINFALDIFTIAIGLFVGMVMKSFFDFYQRSIKKEEAIYSLKKEGLGSYLSFDLPTLYSQKWLQIENVLRDLSAKVFNGSSENEPLSLLMRKLRQKELLSTEENDQVYNLLKIRNQIVYGRSNIRKSELQRALVEADKIHSKIKARMPSS